MKETGLPISLSDGQYWRTDEELVVAVHVRNQGDRTLLVSSAIRQIEFDVNAGTLTLWFSDHGRDTGGPASRCRMNTVPRTLSVEAGKEVVIRARVPARIRRLIGVRKDDIEFEQMDMADVQTVEVHVAVADAPFYFNPKGDSPVAQLKAWGQDFATVAQPHGKAKSD
jgi:hypothetical protein